MMNMGFPDRIRTEKMQRFVTFVDGSNLDGVLKHLNLRVDDYGSFFRPIFEESVLQWGPTFPRRCAVGDGPARPDLLVCRGEDGRVGPERHAGREPLTHPV